MATYAYLRVSTNSQEIENQRYIALEFANSRQLGTVEFIEETVSGKVGWQKRNIAGLVDRLHKDDVLIIAELSRLGRSMLEIMELLSILVRKGTRVHAIKGGYELADNLQAKVLAFAFAMAAEIERELISSRTREALARRRAEGKPLGRPVGSLGRSKLDGKEEQIRELLGYGVAKAAIARILHVSRPALLDFIRSRHLDNGAPVTEKPRASRSV